MGFLAPPPPFPDVLSFNFNVYASCHYNVVVLTSDILQSVESSVDEPVRASNAAARLLRESVAKYVRVSKQANALEDEKTRLVKDIIAAKTEGKTLQEHLISARADVAATKGEVAFLKDELAAARAREDDLATSQGEVMWALT